MLMFLMLIVLCLPRKMPSFLGYKYTHAKLFKGEVT